MRKLKGQSLLYKITAKTLPIGAQIEVTGNCNLNCIHCIRDTGIKNELTTREMKDILLQVREMGCFTVIFTGGEPFYIKDFLEIAGYAQAQGLGIMIYTNGTLINAQNIMRLKKLNPLEIQVSLYGATPQTHEKVTQVKGSFAKTMSAIWLLKKHNLRFLIATMIMNCNFKEALEIKKMSEKNGWSFFPDFILRPTYRGSFRPLSCRLSNRQLNETAKSGLLPALERNNNGARPRKEKLCFYNVGRSNIFITADGKVIPGTGAKMIIGDLRKEPLHYVWNKSERLSWFRGLKVDDFECSKCKLCFDCRWDPLLSLSEYNNLFAVPKEICRISKTRTKIE